MIYPEYTKIYHLCYFANTQQMLLPEQMHDEIKNGGISVNNNYILQYNADWESYMDLCIDDCKKNNIVPILHLDMHGWEMGYADGFGANNINWYRLIKKISTLNHVCKGKLILCLNVCKGLLIYNHIKNQHISLLTIGSYKNIIAKDGQTRFTEMYNDYFNNPKGKDFNHAISVFFSTKTFRQAGKFLIKTDYPYYINFGRKHRFPSRIFITCKR